MPSILGSSQFKQLAFLGLFTAYCISMVVVRYLWTGLDAYSFLVWNLFLAWMPLAFSSFISSMHKYRFGLPLSVLAMIPWLLFLPNAPYILTDLVHLHPRVGVPYWFDILLLASFAFNGLLLGFFSLAQVHQVLRQRMRPFLAWSLMLLFSIGSAYGIYLGRVQRWNSWDILRHPLRLAIDCLRPFVHPYSHKEALAMTAVLAGFFFLGYLAFQSMTKSEGTDQ